MSQPASNPKKRRRGCFSCLGCLGALLVLVAACAGTFLLGPALLRAAGLIPPDPEEIFSGAVDPVQSAAVEESLLEAGIEGARAYVIPVKGRNQHLAVVNFDSSARFRQGQDASGDAVFVELIERLAALSGGGVELQRTVASFTDDQGDPLLAVTVSQAVIESFAKGEITRQEFLGKVDADLSNLLDINRLESLAQRNQNFDREAEIALVAELAAQWAVEKDIVTTNCEPPYENQSCDFAVNVAELVRWRAGQNEILGYGMDLVGLRDIDDEASSALKAAGVVNKIARAESLADEGLKQRNLAKVDEAVALRPKDWSLRDRRGALLTSQGNQAEARRALDEAEQLVEDQIKAGGDCRTLQLNLWRNRRQAFAAAASEDSANRALQDQISAADRQIETIEAGGDGSPCR